jgi:hypothetical protein
MSDRHQTRPVGRRPASHARRDARRMGAIAMHVVRDARRIGAIATHATGESSRIRL